jgi:ABC-2 type transport system permease protein
MARFRSIALGVAWRSMHNLVHNPALLLPSLLFPIFFFVAFAGGLSAVGQTPRFGYDDYTAFQFAFVTIQSAAFGGVFTGFGMAADFGFGFARRLMLAAPHRAAVMVGYALAALARAAFTITLLFGIALVSGMSVGGNASEVVGLVVLALIVNIAASLWASGIAFRFRSLQAAPLMQIPVFLALMTSPVYVPRRLLSGWVHTVSNVNPVTFILEAARGLLFGAPLRTGLAFAIAAGLAAGFAVWGIRGLRKAEAAG